MSNAYVDLCLNVQAIRRYFEGIRTPLALAVGIAASLYTHQVGNVLRVLTDIRVRHLLADEVGLGKTVQALMVLNALRYQRPKKLKALIIVPDRLKDQWRDEIMTRAHTAPFGNDDGNEEEQQYIRLAWEEQLRIMDDQGKPLLSLSDIDPEQFNVLVVDELHHLRLDIQDRIVRVAADFEHVLVLTATPAFQRVKRHAQLFAILEPERTALFRTQTAASEQGAEEQLSANDELSKWPEWAARNVVKGFIDKDLAVAKSCAEEALPELAMVHCAYRRVIRTRRQDYSGVLPRRCHCPIVVEPLGAEAERQSLMWQYFNHLGDLNRLFNPVLLAKRVILSSPSLEQRVDFLRRKGHEREGLLELVKPLVHRSQGDSRADALIDLLAEVWSHDPSERVLVAAQDNLTVDYLFDLVQARLPVIGPLHNRIPLIVSRIRQGMEVRIGGDLGGFGNETTENLEAFQQGDAQVLFVPEIAQVGLNLQCARILVLYSVPWRPEEVEQWIGRLDRIGNVAAFSNNDEAKTIDVYTIVQRGLVDEKVVTVLQRFHVFEHSVNLDGEHLENVAQRIEDAALRPENVNWSELEEATEVMAAQDEEQELDSALRNFLQWEVRSATSERKRLEELPPAPPMLIDLPDHSATGPRSWDRAFEGMLKLLGRSGEYHIRFNTDPEDGRRYRSLWYQYGERGMYNHREVRSRVIFSFGADPSHEHSPRYAHAFITRRGDIGARPRRSVTMSFENAWVKRPLRFLNFGDALHDELVRGWLPEGTSSLMMDIFFFDDHAFWKHCAAGLYILRISVLDPAAVLLNRGIEDRTLKAVVDAAILTPDEQLPKVVLPFEHAINCALEADVRWIRAQLLATMKLEVKQRIGEQWVETNSEVARELLNPMAHGRNGLPQADDLHVTKVLIETAKEELDRLRETDSTASRSAWSHRLPDFERVLNARLLVLREEARDAVSLKVAALRHAEEALDFARERGNRAQVTRAENVRNAAEDAQRMTEVFWQQRDRWLRECEQSVREVQPREQLTAILNALRV